MVRASAVESVTLDASGETRSLGQWTMLSRIGVCDWGRSAPAQSAEGGGGGVKSDVERGYLRGERTI